MASVRGAFSWMRGDVSREIRVIARETHEVSQEMSATLQQVNETAQATYATLMSVNHAVLAMNDLLLKLVDLTDEQRAVLLGLNHDVRSGAEDALPLFLGYTERLRLDTDTAIGAAQVIERQLALLEDLVAASDDPS